VAAAKIEKAGIPTMIVTRETFTPGVISGMASFGFPAEAPTIYEFPMAMFLTGADLTPLQENIDRVVYGLTKWQPKVTAKGLVSAGEKLRFEGKDYEEAFAKMNSGFLKNLWGDGLPILPPTEERVNWILTGTDLPRDTIVGEEGQVLPKGGIPTVESLAVALAMAGGRPEYLPILLATVEAITDPLQTHRSWVSTTHSPFPAVVVNGPIGRQVRLTSRYGVMGPDPRFPAGGSIGRAVRFVLLILGGALPGVGTMAIFGHNRYTNSIFAEDEAGLLLSGWSSLAEDRGFKKDQNVLTLLPVSGAKTCQLHQAFGPTVEDEQIQWLRRIAGDIASPGHFRGWTGCTQCPGETHLFGGCSWPDDPNHSSGIVLIGYNAPLVLEEYGWTKERVRTFLRENAVPSWDELIKYGRVDPAIEPTEIKIAQIHVVVAGGDQSNQALVLQGGTVGGGHKLVSQEIKLPANWDDLLAQAEADLGPIPTV
jgi:hypothetical protein